MNFRKKAGRKNAAEGRERPGRRLEQTVAHLEGVLAGTGVKIMSPDTLMDYETGEMREIDVTMRHSVGSVPMLVIVECRDHSRAQNVLWIEQLASKVKALRANGAIAVSSTGFTSAAIRKATACNIVLRTLRSITQEELLRLFPFSRFAVTEGQFSAHGWALRGVPKGLSITIDDQAQVILSDGIPEPVSLAELYLAYATEIEERITAHGSVGVALSGTMAKPEEPNHLDSQFEFEIVEAGFKLLLSDGSTCPFRAVGFRIEMSTLVRQLTARRSEAYSANGTTHVARVGLRDATKDSDEFELLVVPGEQRYSITAPDSQGKTRTLAAGPYTVPPLIMVDRQDKK